MFVFKENHMTDGHTDDYYREYRCPKDYGDDYGHDHSQEQRHNHGRTHEYGPHMPPDIKLAEAYVPFQKWDGLYPPEEGLKKGTIFPLLYRPYEEKCYSAKCHEWDLRLPESDMGRENEGV